MERINAIIQDKIDQTRIRVEEERAALTLRATLRAEIEALGRDNAAVIRIVREFANFPVPETIMGGDIAGIVQGLPTVNMHEILSRLRELGTNDQLEPSAPPLRLTKPEEDIEGEDDTEVSP
ncbi:hypothetical protein OG292_17470 [Streptomyces sp. NBC_01511]|uniref:hypothetical protein n=1 Tax=Streptomyces sp. NBC_01511 TaxID=2903889 RepID=UPI00386E3A0B